MSAELKSYIESLSHKLTNQAIQTVTNINLSTFHAEALQTIKNTTASVSKLNPVIQAGNTQLELFIERTQHDIKLARGLTIEAPQPGSSLQPE